MRRWLAPFAAGTLVLYVVLALGATTCLVSPADQPTPLHHHSKSHVAHSAFCAWACQANPAESIHAVAPAAVVLELVALLLLLGMVSPAGLVTIPSLARAPPR